jgi:hypothetical protein
MDIYPIRWMSWLAAAFCLGLGVGVVVLLLVAHLSLYDRILFLVSAAVIPFTARELLRELRRPKPALRLDHGGLEGSFGRIPWHNVERISIGTRWDWAGYFQPKVILHLHHRARPASRTRHAWASDWVYSRGRVRGNEVQLQLWCRKKRVKNELSRVLPRADRVRLTRR